MSTKNLTRICLYHLEIVSLTLSLLVGKCCSGEIMLAIWWGTQADEAFPDAWHSDTGDHAHFRSKMYSSPRLWYLRVKVIEAQDLIPPDKGHLPEPVGCQISSGADLSLIVDSQFHDTTGFVYLWMFLCASDHLSRH